MLSWMILPESKAKTDLYLYHLGYSKEVSSSRYTAQKSLYMPEIRREYLKYTKLDGEMKNYDLFIKEFLANLQNLADEEENEEQ